MLLVTPNPPIYNINKDIKNKSGESIHLWFFRCDSISRMNECRATVQMLAKTVLTTRVWRECVHIHPTNPSLPPPPTISYWHNPFPTNLFLLFPHLYSFSLTTPWFRGFSWGRKLKRFDRLWFTLPNLARFSRQRRINHRRHQSNNAF